MKVLLDDGFHHLDIKPDNMMLRSATEVCLSDMGNVSSNSHTSNGGAQMFLCPELYNSTNAKVSSEKVDVWAAGISLYAMLCGKYPYEQMNASAVAWLESLQKGKDPALSNVSEEIRDLVCKMLAIDPDERIGIDDILEHPWLMTKKKEEKKKPKKELDDSASSMSLSSISSSSSSSMSGSSVDDELQDTKDFIVPKKRRNIFTQRTVDELLRELKRATLKSAGGMLKLPESPRRTSGSSTNELLQNGPPAKSQPANEPEPLNKKPDEKPTEKSGRGCCSVQ